MNMLGFWKYGHTIICDVDINISIERNRKEIVSPKNLTEGKYIYWQKPIENVWTIIHIPPNK